jgi:mono/diheme cytochrome c family protein
MPKGGQRLPAQQIALIGQWIEALESARSTFEATAEPIFRTNCVKCHGPEMHLKSLDLSTYAGALKGSESGPVIVPGDPESSLVYKKIRVAEMPKEGQPLSKEQIATIRTWIEGGALSASDKAIASAEPLGIDDILPILYLRCTACHGPGREDGGLNLTNREAMLKGGKSGPALIPGKPDESLIVQKLRSGDMPPKKGLDEVSLRPITPPETDKLAKWIAQGASEAVNAEAKGSGSDPLVSEKDRQFWAFQAPRQPAVPKVANSKLVKNPIDAFVLSKLEAKGLSFSPEASRLTLIRRAYYALTGLPPTPAEAQAFAADQDPKAYDKLIDRLLESPHYGEQWGRYWLDLCGYADSEGGKLDSDNIRPDAWRYRDYVVRSFNSDKPFDRFLLEQIAGDELEDYEHAPAITQQMMDNLVATGFLRMGPDSTYDFASNSIDDRLDVIADELDILGSGVMGLTIKCARCHSHKYDPIPLRDYYRLVAVFKGGFDYYDWLMPQMVSFDGKPLSARKARLLPYIRPTATPVQLIQEEQEREARNEVLDREIKSLKDELDAKAEPIKKKILEQRLAQLPEGVHDDLRKVIDTPADQRTEVQKYLADKFDSLLKIKPVELKQADAEFQKFSGKSERQIKLLEAQREPEPKIRALWDRGRPTPTYILQRGDPANPGPRVEPGIPAVLADTSRPFVVMPPWPGARSTGRRLAFARWLVGPNNPLTARVMVNRIWARHFGVGIVKTLGNLGHTGAPPTNPELLDWLATEFVQHGWSIKAMQKLIMTSTTYRQSSSVSSELERLDPDNVLLSRMPMKRMTAEELCDTLLFVSGRLDETHSGPPQPVEVREDGLVTPIETAKGWRRSLYVEQRRSEIPTMLDSFDLPAMSPHCLQREVATVATQALHLMNNGWVDQLASQLGERLRKEAGSDPQKQIEQAFWTTLARSPSEDEKRVSLEALSRFAAEATKPPVRNEVSSGTPLTSERSMAQAQPKSRKPEPDTPVPLALQSFCHALINSAAFLYID